MKTVGVRELKNGLTEYRRLVRSGDAVLVTDRAEVVAELSSPGNRSIDPSIHPGLSALARRGLITLSASAGNQTYPAIPHARRQKRSAAQLLEEERGAR